MSVKYQNALGDCSNLICYIILLLHAGQGNMKIYSPKSIIFSEGNTRGEYDTRGCINEGRNVRVIFLICQIVFSWILILNLFIVVDVIFKYLRQRSNGLRTITLAGKPARLPRGWNMIFISRNMIFVLCDHVF
jgi:hypothetical protein